MEGGALIYYTTLSSKKAQQPGGTGTKIASPHVCGFSPASSHGIRTCPVGCNSGIGDLKLSLCASGCFCLCWPCADLAPHLRGLTKLGV